MLFEWSIEGVEGLQRRIGERIFFFSDDGRRARLFRDK